VCTAPWWMRCERKGALSNGLAFDSQSIGWSAVGAALQNHCVGACNVCGFGDSDRSRSSAGQLRLVDCCDDSRSQRQHARWLLCRNVISAFPGCPFGEQTLSFFSYYVSAKHRALAPLGAGQCSHRRAHSVSFCCDKVSCGQD